MERMYEKGEDVYYYLTAYNENYEQPAKPKVKGVDSQIISGLYKWADAPAAKHPATILFSGSAHSAAREAQTELAAKWDVAASLWSATSYKRLREDAMEVERWNRLHPTETPRVAYVTEALEASEGPIVAVSDYMRAVQEQIQAYAPRSYLALGTDGFGRSDERMALRRFFETNTPHIVVAVLSELASNGEIPPEIVAKAITEYGIDTEADAPWTR